MNRWTLIAIGAAAAVAGFLLQAPGPVGKLVWPLPGGMPAPEGANFALLMLMGAIEAVAFGVGAVFLVVAWPWVKANGAGSSGLSWAVYLSVAWLLMNWVPHTALHMSHGNILVPADYTGLVAIEYGFHFTLILAGAVLAWYAVRSVRSMAWQKGAASAPAAR